MIRMSLYLGVLIPWSGSMAQICLAGEEELPSRLRPTALPKSMQVRREPNFHFLIILDFESLQ